MHNPFVPFRLLPILVVALSLGSAGSAFAGNEALPDELLSAAKTLSAHGTVKASFEQTKTSVLFVEDMVRTGTLEMRRSDSRLLWTYNDGPAFLMAGGRFYPAGKTAEEVGKEGAAGFAMPGAGDMTGVLQAVFTLAPDALAAHFSVVVSGPGTFELTPTDAAAKGMFSKVLLTVGGSPLAVRRTLMHEPTGDVTSIVFSEVSVGGELAKQRFLTPSERSAAGTQ